MNTHALYFIQDLAIIMIFSAIANVICYHLKQPIVLGYIITGIIVGPHTPPFSLIHDENTIQTFADLGVIFLMFSLGLEFNLHNLFKVGKTSIVTALLEIVFMVWLGYMLGRLFGWDQLNSIFLGGILAISSTTIIVKALAELNLKHEKFSHIIFGVLIVEDIFAILLLTLLTSIALSGTLHFSDIISSSAKLTSFLIVSLILGILFVPRLLAYVAKSESSEILLITVLGLCFGFCLMVVKFDYSVALGAFIIGAVIAESKQIKQIEHLISPIRDMFSVLFFVSVGLLFNPVVLKDYMIPVTIITLAVIIGKIISCSLGSLITGNDGRTSLRIGMGLAQIGEFSFIIAALGITLNVTGNFLYSIAVCVSIITTFTTPYLIKHSDTVSRYLTHLVPNKIAIIFAAYSAWITNIKPSTEQQKLKALINRGIIHVFINMFVVIAIFMFGTYLVHTSLGMELIKTDNDYALKTIIWAAALITSLPFLIASYRKIKALSMVLAEFTVKEGADQTLTYKLRGIIAEVIPVIAIFIIMLLVFLLSASILPQFESLMLILISASILCAYVWPWFIKIHAKIQASIIEAINKDHE